jgi:sucrose-phosphate synthase
MGFNILHLHLHGLFRGHDLELGRDPDTGGQTTYVLELARAMAARPEVERVEVVTRLIRDRRVSSDYARPLEPIGPDAAIRRLPFGPPRYLRKELLWPHLDELADALTEVLVAQPRLPDWIHAHYADAGYVGALLRRRLGIPLVFTGHSLGREKRRRLMLSGLDPRQIDQTYAMARRIDAEELVLAHASMVVTSTSQEREQQYARYGRFRLEQARVIPPGVDARQFRPPLSGEVETAIDQLVQPFLRNPAKPPVLAICRADHRKNIPALVEVFGRSEHLRKNHNLVLVLGCRDDPRELEKQQREVFQQVFEQVDRFDLYGQVAYPKQHRRDQIPAFYRWAAQLGGVFVNPALTEPFGLTLLEAAACGLPIVATDDGGPRDILSRTDSGLLVDVSDLDALQQALEASLASPLLWRRWSENGIEAVSRHFSWNAHVCSYLGEAAAAAARHAEVVRHSAAAASSDASVPGTSGPMVVPPRRLAPPQRLLLFDLDVLLASPDDASLVELRRRLEADPRLSVGVFSGRSFKAACQRFAELHLPAPRVTITQAGTDIRFRDLSGPELGWCDPGLGDVEPGGEWAAPGLEIADLVLDPLWQQQIGRSWQRQEVVAAMAELEPRLCLQDESEQGPYKVSYVLQEPDQGILPLVRQALRNHALQARPHVFQHWFLDVLPLTASKAEAIRYVALRWKLPLSSILVGASQQGDGELLQGLPLGVVPEDHDPSLESLRGHRRVYFYSKPQAWGLLDGLDHHRFLRR